MPRPSPLYLLVGVLSYLPVSALLRVQSSGVEHVPDGGFVLAASHLSNLDPWVVGLPLFPRRYLRFMGKSELFHPLLAPLLRAGGAFPVRRGERDQEAIDTAVGLCRAGEVVVMFPEGTRRRKGLRKRHPARPHTGAARIALQAGVPLVPAGIVGTDRLLRLPRVRVRYGRPIDLADLAGRDVREAAQTATERLMAAIAALEAAA